MKTKLTLLFLFLVFVKLDIQAQIKINQTEIESNTIVVQENKKVDSISMNFKSNLKTSGGVGYENDVKFGLYIKRDDLKVILNLSVINGNPPNTIIIERKSSAPLSEYRTVKVLSEEEISKLIADNKLIFDDNFPESRQLDSYYRIKYQKKDDMMKLTPGVLLPKQNAANDELYGDHETDENLFVDDEVAAIEKEKKDDKGVSIYAERNGTKVILTIQGSNYLKLGQKMSIERKTTEYLATFRRIKELTQDDIDILLSEGVLIVEDKFPASVKVGSFYRLVVVHEDDTKKEFPATELPRLRAK